MKTHVDIDSCIRQSVSLRWNLTNQFYYYSGKKSTTPRKKWRDYEGTIQRLRQELRDGRRTVRGYWEAVKFAVENLV